jgi:CRISPR-associated protein (TIGR02584 family)
LTPQIVTEMLWALALRAGWTPDRIVLFTTILGAAAARRTLIDPETGAIAALARAYRRPDLAKLAERVEIEVMAAPDGTPLDDLASDEAARWAGDAALRFVRGLTENSSELHLSIAGGRKSMSALLAIAMTLYARPGDRMSHVTIRPGGLAQPHRFFPSCLGETDLQVALIPFPRLRPAQALDDAATLAEAVAAAQRRIEPPRCRIRLGRGELAIDDDVLRPPPILLAFAAALAADAIGLNVGLPRVGLPRARVARLHARIHGARSQSWPDPLDPERVQEWASRLNKLVVGCKAWPPARNFVVRIGPWSQARYRLAVPCDMAD